jgi:hypothetical protein
LKLSATLFQIAVFAQHAFKFRVHLESLERGQARAVRPRRGSLSTVTSFMWGDRPPFHSAVENSSGEGRLFDECFRGSPANNRA